MRMRTRLTAAAVLAATTLGLAAAPGSPAGADETPVPASKAASKTFSFSGFSGDSMYNTETFTAPGTTPIVGKFEGSGADDILWYTPGSGGDALWTNNGGMQFSSSAASISGTYAPKVGVFATPDDYDDVLWYSTTGASQLWDFNGNGSITKTALPSVTGPGQILIGDFAGDSIDDVIRYRPGAHSDSWWDFQQVQIQSRPLNVSGTYTPIVGNFAGDVITDIFWYAPGSAGDPLWDMNGGGTKVQWGLNVNGTYKPVVGNFSLDGAQDILWYAPGSAGDPYWDFELGGYETEGLSVNGTYSPVACTCLQSGSTWEDIVFYGAGGAGDAAWKTTSAQQLDHTSVATSIHGSSVAAVGAFYDSGIQEHMLIRH